VRPNGIAVRVIGLEPPILDRETDPDHWRGAEAAGSAD
jgi:hypothetical protein